MGTGTAVNDDHAQAGPIRAQMERVLGSPDFVRAERACAFLRFIVEETLAGRADHIKAFTVALGVFDRDETFDPGTDTIVRVEAGALRRRLERYYLTVGRDDPIVIDVPKGAYVPVFRPRGTPTTEKISEVIESTPISTAVPGRRKQIIALAGASVIAAITAITLMTVLSQVFLPADDRRTAAEPSSFEQGSLERGVVDPAKPFVAVLPLETQNPLEARLADGLVESVIARLARLSSLSVMAHSSVFGTDVIALEPAELYRDYGVTHVLRGKLQIEGKSLSVSSYLIEANTGVIVWTDRDERRVEEILDVEPDLVRRVALTLGAQLHPDEAMRLQRRYTNDPEVLKLFSDAMRLLHPPSHKARMMAGRELFERTVTLDPSFAPGYAGRSLNYSTPVVFGLSQSPQRDSQEAIELARIALDLDSTLGLGHAALGVAYAASGRPVEALAHARRAVELDPGDAASHAHLGGVLIQSGRSDEAIEQIAEAIRLNPIQVTSPFLNLLGCAYLNVDRYASAVEAFTRNINRGGPSGPPMDALLAAAYAELGLEAEASAAISSIVVPPTEFPVGNFLRRWIPSDELRRRTFADLRRLGLALE